MTTRKEAIKACRTEIKNRVAQVRAEKEPLRREIRTLKWKPEAETELPKLRAEQKTPAGHNDAPRIRAALKALRRPETGPQRWQLHQEKMCAGPSTRWLYLAYAILRGRTYRSVEPTARPFSEWAIGNSARWIHSELIRFYGDHGWSIGDVKSWLLGSPMPKAKDEAA